MKRRRLLGHACALAGLAVSGPACRAAPVPGEDVLLQLGPGAGRLTVVNLTGIPQRLRTAVIVEQQVASGWAAVVTEMNLVAGCDPRGAVLDTAACTVLGPQQSLTAPPWLGWSCNGQCQLHCRANIYWSSGPFRLAVLACDGPARFVSAAFPMPSLPRRP